MSSREKHVSLAGGLVEAKTRRLEPHVPLSPQNEALPNPGRRDKKLEVA
jgi:hypothetical protein